MSDKRRAIMGKRKKVREIVLARDDNRCQAQIDGCTLHATDVHEILTRGRGGSITDPQNCLSLCRTCHQFITDNPAWAEEHGFIVSQFSGHAEWIAAERARHEWMYREPF